MPDAGFLAVLARGRLPARQQPPSYDKQFVRDYLETLDWDKTPPAPGLPAEIIERTSGKYLQALDLITHS